MRMCSAAIAVAVLTLAALTGGGRAETPETPPDYSPYQQSYRVPFANTKPVDFDHLQTMLVRVSINGGPPLLVQVDNGSNGVIIGADDVPNIEPNAPAGWINYVSSGVELNGVWTPATVTFLDAKDEHGNAATALVPVLAVHEKKVREGAVNSGSFKTTKNPKIYMLGVGSGRGKEAHQEKNPFVNLKEMQTGTMRRGYTITRDGITLGLPAQSVGDGYLFEKLKEHVGTNAPARTAPPVPKDWDGSLGWATVGGTKTETSSMLLDTGLTNMMIELPSVPGQSDVAEGTEVSVHLLSGRLSYSFKVGDFSNPATPRRVTWVKYASGPLINTGLRALALYDYLYDADGGWLGLRPVRKLNVEGRKVIAPKDDEGEKPAPSAESKKEMRKKTNP